LHGVLCLLYFLHLIQVRIAKPRQVAGFFVYKKDTHIG